MGHRKKQKEHSSGHEKNDISEMLNSANLNDILSKYSKGDEESSENIVEEDASSNNNNNNNNNINELLGNINVEELISQFSASQNKNKNFVNSLAANPTIIFLNSLRPFINKNNYPMLDNFIKMYAIGSLISSNSSSHKN